MVTRIRWRATPGEHHSRMQLTMLRGTLPLRKPGSLASSAAANARAHAPERPRASLPLAAALHAPSSRHRLSSRSWNSGTEGGVEPHGCGPSGSYPARLPVPHSRTVCNTALPAPDADMRRAGSVMGSARPSQRSDADTPAITGLKSNIARPPRYAARPVGRTDGRIAATWPSRPEPPPSSSPPRSCDLDEIALRHVHRHPLVRAGPARKRSCIRDLIPQCTRPSFSSDADGEAPARRTTGSRTAKRGAYRNNRRSSTGFRRRNQFEGSSKGRRDPLG